MSRPSCGIIVAFGALTIACAPPATQSSPATASAAPARTASSQKTLAEWFQGRAGVEVSNVGSGIRIKIRGSGDYDGRGDPLFVIDGVSTEPPGGVLVMNPNDIASVEILKDDASTAIYGLRGANGVVKITTKRK